MTDCEYVKLNTSIQTASNAGGLVHDENGNVEATVELRLPDNLFSNNQPRRRINKVEMETTKLRISMENTPIAAMPLDASNVSMVKYKPSTAELSVYPFVITKNDEVYPDLSDETEASSFPLYKQHKTDYVLRVCTDVTNETFVTFAEYQTTAYATDFPKTSPYYGILKNNDVFVSTLPGFALSFPEADIVNGKLYVKNARDLEHAIASALEYAISYACTQDTETVFVDFVTADQASVAGVDVSKADSVYVEVVGASVYFWKTNLGEGTATSKLLSAFKPTVEISGQSLTVKYDTACFEDTIPILYNSEYVQTYDYPFQMNLDLLRQSLWYKPPPKRMYRFGVNDAETSYNYSLLFDWKACVFNIIGNKAMRDSLSFLPWKKVNLSQLSIPRSNRYLVEMSKQSSYSATVPTYEAYISNNDCTIESRAAYGVKDILGLPQNEQCFFLPLESGKADNVFVSHTILMRISYMESLIAEYADQYTQYDEDHFPDAEGAIPADMVRLTAAMRDRWPGILSDETNVIRASATFDSRYLSSAMGKTLVFNNGSKEMIGTTGPVSFGEYYTTEELTPGTQVVSEYEESLTIPEKRTTLESGVKSMMIVNVADNIWVADFTAGVTTKTSLHYDWYPVIPASPAGASANYGKGYINVKPFFCEDVAPEDETWEAIRIWNILNMSDTAEGATASTLNMKIGEILTNQVQLVAVEEETNSTETIVVSRSVTIDGTAPSIEYIPNLSIDGEKDDFYILDANTANLVINQPEVVDTSPSVTTSEHKFKIVEETTTQIISKTRHTDYKGSWGWGSSLTQKTVSPQIHWTSYGIQSGASRYIEKRYYLVRDGVVDGSNLLGATVITPDMDDHGPMQKSIPAKDSPPLGILTNYGKWIDNHSSFWTRGLYVIGYTGDTCHTVTDQWFYSTPDVGVEFSPVESVETSVSYSDDESLTPGATTESGTTEEVTSTLNPSYIEPTAIRSYTTGVLPNNAGYYPACNSTLHPFTYIPGVDHGYLRYYSVANSDYRTTDLTYNHFVLYDYENDRFVKYYKPLTEEYGDAYFANLENAQFLKDAVNCPAWMHYLTPVYWDREYCRRPDGEAAAVGQRYTIRDRRNNIEFQVQEMIHMYYITFPEDDSAPTLSYMNPLYDNLWGYNLSTYFSDRGQIGPHYPNPPDTSSPDDNLFATYSMYDTETVRYKRTVVRTIIDLRPKLSGNVQLTYTWSELPMVVMSPIASIILTMEGINFTSEIQPVNMTTPGSGSSLTQTIPVAENYYSLAQTLRDLHDELVVTRADFDSNAKYTLERTCGDERSIRLTAHYLSKDGTLHKIYIPPNGVFAIQLTFRISYFYI